MALSHKARRRLLMFCRYMENLPKKAAEHFDMRDWFEHRGDDDHDFKPGSKLSKKHLGACGTVACALGWAATVPQLQRVGLAFVFDEYGGFDVLFDGKDIGIYQAAAQAFDITNNQAIDLFSMSGPSANAKTPQEWAESAREAMREWR